MVNLDALPRDQEVHLGWTLETKPEFFETYLCYAWAGEGDGSFRVRARAVGDGDAPARFEASRALCLQAARGKIFFGTWQRDAEYDVEPLSSSRNLATPLIRQMILRGLHRLYEEGFQDGDFQIDLDGIALELGVKRELVDRAVDFLYEHGYVEEPHTMGQHRGTGYVWLTHDGAEFVESQGLAVETFLQELYDSTLTRLFSISPDLATAFEGLRERATSPSTRQEIKGYATMVRDFVQELTDRLHERTNPAEALPRGQTINKVKAITAAALSDTSREHVRALAEVVVTHWSRLNDVQQKGVHEGTVESQRLFTYTLLFVADLLDVVEGGETQA